MSTVTRVTLGTAAGAGTLVAQNTQSWTDGAGRRVTTRVAIAQVGTAGTVWLGGGTDVATTNGFPFVMTAGAATASGLILDLEPGDAVYGISAVNGGTLAVFQTGS